MGYRDELKDVAISDNSLYPDFIWSVTINDYDDGYYERAMSSNPAAEAARKLKRKYGDPFEYMAALQIYFDYMDILLEKYKSESIIAAGVENGVITEYVPAKPKLKPSKSNKQFLKCEGVPSRALNSEEVDYKELSDTMYSEAINDGEELLAIDDGKELPKSIRKMLKRSAREVEGLSRLEKAFITSSSSEAHDFIVDMLNQMNEGSYTFSGEHKELTTSEIMAQNEADELIDEDIAEYNLMINQNIVKNGRYVSYRDEVQIGILKDFYNAGIDLLGTGAKGKDGKIVRLARKAVGYGEHEGAMSKKEQKAYKKRAKQEKKLLKKKNNDALLEQALLGNKFQFSSSSVGNNIRFSLADMMGHDD